MITIKGLPEQTIYDVAIKRYGDVSGIAELIRDNSGIHEVEKVQDMDIQIRKNYVLNRPVVRFFEGKEIVTY